MFVHLRLHTEFSVVDGTNRIDDVVAAAAADGQPALAITDLNNLFGAIKFYKAARGKGVKPLIGAEVVFEGLGKDVQATSRLLLLVQNRQGYLNLSELLARAHTRSNGRGQPQAQWAWLEELSGGLLAQGDAARAHEVALLLAGHFPHRFYIELQRAGRPDDERHVAAAVQLAARMGLPVVATLEQATALGQALSEISGSTVTGWQSTSGGARGDGGFEYTFKATWAGPDPAAKPAGGVIK